MHHRKRAFAFVLVLSAIAGGAAAQDLAAGKASRTGDAWVDARLSDIDDYGRRYREAFIDEIVRYHGAPRTLVSDLVANRRWAPGDVYYACALARIAGRPCRHVADARARGEARDWDELAVQLGVAPGTDRFHRLKRGIVSSYDRWSRPVALDDELRRAFAAGKGRDYAWSPVDADGHSR